MRGVDWQWDDQDGGNMKKGKVLEIKVSFIVDEVLARSKLSDQVIFVSLYLGVLKAGISCI